MIYTSGSTGNPKGVMVTQANVVNFLSSMQSKPGINSSDCLLAVTSTSFDIHGLELFLPLAVGAKTVIASKNAVSDSHALITLINRYSVNLMQATPATWKMLVDGQWQPTSAIKVLCGGEALSESLASKLTAFDSTELWNMYGPTETTIWSCVKQVSATDGQVSMGLPIANTQVYLLNEQLQIAPEGAPAELFIGGEGVTRGYLNRPDLTAQVFIDNPFYDKSNPDSSERLYKTGDLV
ncbi:non-ribosomal peptide synthetase, partial [Motilimonas pumila]